MQRGVTLWALYIAGLVLFSAIRALADETGVPTQVTYPILGDRVFGSGVIPTIWLQQWFYRDGQVGVHDIAAHIIYSSHFYVIHLVGLVLWFRYPERFRSFLTLFLGTLAAALLMHFLVPTAPPWLAAQKGHLPHIFRIVKDMTVDVSPGLYQRGYEFVGINDVAAMPSVHMALPTVIAIIVWPISRWAGIVASIYTVVMAVTLIYTGEHYMVDSLVGVLIPVLVWRMVARPSLRPARATRRSRVTTAVSQRHDASPS